jgi:hypothetical protein
LDDISMKNSTQWTPSYEQNTKPIKRHVTLRSTIRPVQLGPPPALKLVAEWQQGGPETLSGHALQKLRLAFAPTQSVITASAAA